jgi:FKBP-type peptidyl-prolyl cis-trans isomerase SlyD
MENISKNKVVRLTYELRDAGNDTLIEKVEKEQPFTFLYGVGGLVEEFETNLSNLTVGDSFDFKIKSENAYGAIDETAVVDIPKEAFMIEGKLQEDMLEVGNVLPMRDNDGNFLQGRITGLTDSAVLMDFNHPLAGKDLHFKGEILEVRAATAEEIDHGHVHGEGGHHH